MRRRRLTIPHGGKTVLINLSLNLKDVTRSLRTFERKQLPFAIAGALNATAFDARKAVKKNLFKKFILRNKWTERGVIVVKANKHELTAWVNLNRGYMYDQEEGGTRTPGGQSIAVPMGVRKDKKRRITKAKRPRALLDKPNTFIIRKGESSRLPAGIYQRMRGRKVKLLYALEPKITIKPKLNMEKTVAGVVNSRFFANFNRAMARALK